MFDSKWFVGVEYQRISISQDWAYFDEDEDIYEMSVGYYWNETSEISAFYSNSSYSDSFSGYHSYDAKIVEDIEPKKEHSSGMLIDTVLTYTVI